jgi:hypothetical protein
LSKSWTHFGGVDDSVIAAAALQEDRPQRIEAYCGIGDKPRVSSLFASRFGAPTHTTRHAAKSAGDSLQAIQARTHT